MQLSGFDCLGTVCLQPIAIADSGPDCILLNLGLSLKCYSNK